MSDESQRPSPLKVWMVAVRPFAYTASVTSVLLAVALSVYSGFPMLWGRFLLSLLGVCAFHTAANLLNDCYDHARGLDRQVLPTSGAVVRGWLTERQVFKAAMLMLAIGVTCGLLLTWLAGWMILAIGAVGSLIALGYTRKGFCFKYAGLGDLAIFLAFGVLPVFGTYWAQAEQFSWLPVYFSVPLASYTVGILHANNWHDIASDPAQGCTTMASRLGDAGSASYYRLLMLGPFALTVFAVLLRACPEIDFDAPWSVLLVFLALVPAFGLTRVRREKDEKLFAMLDAKTAQVQLMFGLLLPLGILLGHWFPVLR